MVEPSKDREPLSRLLERSLLPRLRALQVESGSPIYLVGGLVRDLMRGVEVGERDLDVASPTPSAMLAQHAARLFRGRPFPLDANTWRIVFRCGAERWQLDIASLRGEDLPTDLRKRDFTVNAMALEVAERPPRLHDPLDGRADLACHRLRQCGPDCFRDDPLRLLRAVRLRAQLSFSIEEETWKGIQAEAHLLEGVSRERVRDEFFKILAHPHSARHIEALQELGLIETILPGISAMEDIAQGPRHHFALWEHSLKSLQALESLPEKIEEHLPQWSSLLGGRLRQRLGEGIDAFLVLKWVALLHDIGKPEVRTEEEDGRVRFTGHEEAGRAKMRALCRSLRVGRKVGARAEALVASHLRPILLASEEQWTRRAQVRFFRDLGEVAIDLLLLGWADLSATVEEGHADLHRYLDFLRRMLRFAFEESTAASLSPLVRGRDVMEALGLHPGPLIGDLLERLQEAQAEGLFHTKAAGLQYLEEHLEEWRRKGDPGAGQGG